MPADPPCPDLDALEQALAEIGRLRTERDTALVVGRRLQAHAEKLRAALVEACDAMAAAADFDEALTAMSDDEERARIDRLRSVASCPVHPGEDVAP